MFSQQVDSPRQHVNDRTAIEVKVAGSNGIHVHQLPAVALADG